MLMDARTIILFLSIALLAGICLLLVGVGKFAYGILHYYLRERQSVRQFHHPAFGVLTGEGELWSGAARLGIGQVRFSVGGTELAPADSEMQRLAMVLGKFSEVYAPALKFLRVNESEIAEAELEIYGLDINESPDSFTVSFVAKGDDSRVWWVEFEDEKPKNSGFDD
jgi:hypothetical protein